ncbi:hypothetical protein EI94DRAFT_1702462 [Lactarius quietus]|nr:hypothetical protein EI94DRAFT_1702462 [Lactarius quietus]
MPDNDEQMGPSNETGRDMNNAPDIPAMESSNTIKLSEPLDENNWTIWKERMKLALCLCGLEGHAEGTIKRPDEPLAAKRWDFDDSRAQFITINNITTTKMVHIDTCTTARHLYFKIIISSSLPSSWDTFTEPFVGGMKGEESSKKSIPIVWDVPG